MVSPLHKLDAPVIPLPRTRFEAMVVASSPMRRSGLVARLRALGAREVIEAGSAGEARARARQDVSRDVAVVDGALSDGTALPLIADLRAAGWRRTVLLSPRSDAAAVRGALGAGVRGYLVMPDDGEPVAPVRTLPKARNRPTSPDELSAREIEVVQFVADGRSNKEIGDIMGLSALTVKSHLARIARKLGTGDRAEMVALSIRAGDVR